MENVKQRFLIIIATILSLLPQSRATAVDSWELIMLPDTQFYVNDYWRHTFLRIFQDQTEWIRNRRIDRGIRFVTHVGDVVNDGAADMDQWSRAEEAIDVLDGEVPYSICCGDHDFDVRKEALSGRGVFVSRFGPSRYSLYSWYGGSDIRGVSHYQIFSGTDRQYLHLNLECGPSDSALKWAQDIIDAHPTLPAIVSTHIYMDANGARPVAACYGGNDGGAVWRKFIRHNDQIFMVLNGHYCGEKHKSPLNNNAYGHPVIEIMADYQCRTDWYNDCGYLNIIHFEPDNNLIKVRTYSPHLDLWENDSDSNYDISFDFSTRFNSFTPRPSTSGVQAANIQVVQHDTLDNPSSVTVSIPFGQSTADFGMKVPNQATYTGDIQTDRGDVAVAIGSDYTNDNLNGVLVATISENGRDNGSGLRQGTLSLLRSRCGALGICSFAAAADKQELNINSTAAYFPFAGGWSMGWTENQTMEWATTSSDIILNTHLTHPTGGVQKPTGETFSGAGTYELSIPQVNSLLDGVLLVHSAIDSDDYAAASPTADGSKWCIVLRNNSMDTLQTNEQRLSFVYLPYDTPGLVLGRITGPGGVFNQSGDFYLQREGEGIYRLHIYGHTPATGSLQLATEAYGTADDNVLTFQPDGDDFLIHIRDLPALTPETPPSESFVFAFIPFADPPQQPGRRLFNPQGQVALAKVEVIQHDNNDTPTSVSSYVQRTNALLTTPWFDRGDYELYQNGQPLLLTPGVLMAQVSQLCRYHPDEGPCGVAVASVDVPSGAAVITTARAGASYGNPFNVNTDVAFFPSDQGWTAGHVFANGNVSASSGQTPLVSKQSYGKFTLELPGVNAHADGVLLTISNCGAGTNRNNVTAAAPIPGNLGWSVAIRDAATGDAEAFEEDRFSYVYVPFSATGLVAARIGADGSILQSTGNCTVTHVAPGMYQLQIFGYTASDGVLLLTLSEYDNVVLAAQDNILVYEGYANNFYIFSHDLPGLQEEDAAFSFVFIPFDSTPQPEMLSPLIYLPFDGDYVNRGTAGYGEIGTVIDIGAGLPVFSTGIKGECIDLTAVAANGEAGSGVYFGQDGPTNSDIENALNNLFSFTTTWWVNPAGQFEENGNPFCTGTFWARQADDLWYNSTMRAEARWWGGSFAYIGSHSSAGSSYTHDASLPSPWIFQAITYDAATEKLQMYRLNLADVPYGSDPIAYLQIDVDEILYGAGLVAASNNPLVIGNRSSNGLSALDGLIDEFRLYGSTLDARAALDQLQIEAIVRLDLDSNECGQGLHQYPRADITRNCFVDSADLAAFANDWLVDNRPYITDQPDPLILLPLDGDTVNYGTIGTGEAGTLITDYFTPAFAEGIAGQCLDLTAAPAQDTMQGGGIYYEGATAAAMDGLQSFTVTFWANRAGQEPWSYNTFFSRRNPGQEWYQVGCGAVCDLSGRNQLWVNGDGGYLNRATSGGHNDWIFCAWTYDATSGSGGVKAYRAWPETGYVVEEDSYAPASATVGALVSSTYPLFIGCRWYGGASGTDGLIDDFRFYGSYTDGNGALAINQIQQVVNLALLGDGGACGDEDHPYPPGDLNYDCVVDLADFAILAGQWLVCQ
ncbi:MAG: hypothetical protein JXA42_08650 [Anaerolineales bacterium]|nr:hypothetical protein [Anaerolineales bacterium]